jgi:hypothetical protein
MRAARVAIVEAAASLIGPYGKGSPEVYEIWRDVLPEGWRTEQVIQYAKTREWCGGFALHCLHLAGVARNLYWHDGIGFLGPLHSVPYPRPGDIAVKAIPFAHHMVVEYWNHELDWGDVAGNTPHAARHKHTSSAGITFYSIEPLLPAAADTDPSPAPDDEDTMPDPWRRTLRIGSTGPDVSKLQAALNAYMAAGLKADGVYGPITARAVMTFQRDKDLDADGIAGTITQAALFDKPKS